MQVYHHQYRNTQNEEGDMSDIDMETKPDKKDRKKKAVKKEIGTLVVGPAVIAANNGQDEN